MRPCYVKFNCYSIVLLEPDVNPGAQSTELVSLYIGYWTLNNYYYY